MVRGMFAAALGVAALLFADQTRAASPANGFTGSGTLIRSVDQLAPIVSYDSTTEDANGAKTTDSATSIGVVVAGFGSNSGLSFHQIPHLAIDYVLGPGVTIGGSAWVYANVSASRSVSPSGGGSSVSNDRPKGTFFGFAPRVGYALPVGEALALWPRVGIEYADLELSSVTNNNVTTGGGSVNQLSLQLDGLLVWTPINHFGLTIGPTGDIPLTGKVNAKTTFNGTTTTVSNDVAMWHVGLTVGLLGYL